MAGAGKKFIRVAVFLKQPNLHLGNMQEEATRLDGQDEARHGELEI